MSVKLLCIAGPSKGATYFLQNGETSIGRLKENDIMLESAQVSKRHTIISVNGDKVEIRDAGSSNGTFVNGILTKQRRLQARDKISIGPFVFDLLVQSQARAVAPVGDNDPLAQGMAPVPFEGGGALTETMSASAQIAMETNMQMGENPSLLAKLKKRFDEVVLPVLHDFHERQDTLTLMIILFVVYVALNIGFSVYPILEQSREEVIREAENHAKYIASQIEIINRNAIVEGREAALNVDFAEMDMNVKEAIIVNLEGRIMAPANRLNESYSNTRFLIVRDRMLKDPGAWRVFRYRGEDEITVIHPMMVFSKTKQMNVPGALAVVVLSIAGKRLDSGTIGVIYFEALSTSVILGGILIYLLYALTQQPLLRLNSEIDKALRGDLDEVDKKYQNEEMNRLIDSVNSLLSRIPKVTGDTSADTSVVNDQQAGEQLIRSMSALSQILKTPATVLDAEYNVCQINSAFEELTGIRGDGALGQPIEAVARDESFPALLRELGEKSKIETDGAAEDYEFPSGIFKVTGFSLTAVQGRPSGVLYVIEKAEG